MERRERDLLGNIFIAGLANEGERQNENICSTITQRSQSVIIFLSCFQKIIENDNPVEELFNNEGMEGTSKDLPAVSHNPKFTVLPFTTTFALKLSKTVGT